MTRAVAVVVAVVAVGLACSLTGCAGKQQVQVGRRVVSPANSFLWGPALNPAVVTPARYAQKGRTKKQRERGRNREKGGGNREETQKEKKKGVWAVEL